MQTNLHIHNICTCTSVYVYLTHADMHILVHIHTYTHTCIKHGWTDGGMMNGRRDRWIDRKTAGKTDRQTHNRTNRQTIETVRKTDTADTADRQTNNRHNHLHIFKIPKLTCLFEQHMYFNTTCFRYLCTSVKAVVSKNRYNFLARYNELQSFLSTQSWHC